MALSIHCQCSDTRARVARCRTLKLTPGFPGSEFLRRSLHAPISTTQRPKALTLRVTHGDLAQNWIDGASVQRVERGNTRVTPSICVMPSLKTAHHGTRERQPPPINRPMLVDWQRQHVALGARQNCHRSEGRQPWPRARAPPAAAQLQWQTGASRAPPCRPSHPCRPSAAS